ncbi:terminase large subunit [Vibrio phage vB_VpaP_GHSM17]|uniref:Terminase large subunit n=1 Tax=Vibrio phage vB_VpaP_GHSM17 TaxID=2911515 RepID=A0AAE9KQ91_9CAUD|nr:terminase large subunit [Vibrio phage vB_VpaP_GHSM17]
MGLSVQVITRLKLLAQRCKKLAENPRSIPVDTRQELALMFAITFKNFEDFAYVGMRFLGFDLTDMQADIAQYMQHGPRKKMVCAQRGEAKSTLAALYSVWRLIQDQSTRVLIVSGGEKQASEVATLVIRLIETWDLLCWLRADPARGDRTSYEGYDVHCDLKPLEKAPSVACVGITAQLQGKRADLLIPDDIETTKNGLTQTQREHLLTISKDFAAINTHGDTLYLGTPQTKDSIYKTLPSRGFEVRVWCGRIPSVDQEEKYGDTLAPYIKMLIEQGARRTGFGVDGTLGETTDPQRYDEEALIEKELDFGPEGFALQYMLDTTLSDAMRTRIKLSDMIIHAGDSNSAPDMFSWTADKRALYPEVHDGVLGARLYTPLSIGTEIIPYKHKVMVIDPAGCGGDEISFAIGGAASAYVHLFSTGGFQGGVSEENMNRLIDLAEDFEVKDIVIESNMGHGTVTMLFQNALAQRDIAHIGVRDLRNSTQKERRIIDTISPVTRRHRLVVHTSALDMDIECCMSYPRDRRWQYSAFLQLQDITYDKGCLSKDDRADAIAMLVQELNAHLVEDERSAAEKALQMRVAEFILNPMAYQGVDTRPRNKGTASRLSVAGKPLHKRTGIGVGTGTLSRLNSRHRKRGRL